jgi:phosphodiesterase/alkaline phosphatase D-like protein
MPNRRLPALALILAIPILALVAAVRTPATATRPLHLAGTSSLFLPTLLTPTLFPLGVASGDVTGESAVLWAWAAAPAELTLQVATDPAFANVVHEESVTAGPATGQTARARVAGLAAATGYFYRWLGEGMVSPTGAFRTAPPASAAADLHFAFSGDSDGTRVNGLPYYNYFESLSSARAEGLDFFVYLGDLIYSDSGLRPGGQPAVTLDEYRGSYLENRRIPSLPALNAAAPLIAIWDDHEVYNDFDGLTADPIRFANGRQALLEFMPIDTAALPHDPACPADPLFRVIHWGQAADIIVLDERTCRSADAVPACTSGGETDLVPALPSWVRVLYGLPPAPPAGCLQTLNDPARTLLGPVQKQALKDALLASTAQFKFVVNEVPIQQFYAFPYDRWEGYAAERTEILEFIRDQGIENVVFLTTDAHANLINEVFLDWFTAPGPLAWEFVTGPIAAPTLEDIIVAFGGQEELGMIQELLDQVGAECRHLDIYSYGSVEVDAAAGTAAITLKDQDGQPIEDEIHPGVMCAITLPG